MKMNKFTPEQLKAVRQGNYEVKPNRILDQGECHVFWYKTKLMIHADELSAAGIKGKVDELKELMS